MVGKTTLAYTRIGSGPAVLMVHGWPVDRRLWREVAPLLAARGLTVVTVDLPGLGDSAPPPRGDYRKVATADQLHTLMQRLGHERFSLVGHDIGGMVAYALAAKHPGSVERLVLSEFWLPGFGLEEGMDVAGGGSFHFGFHMQVERATELTKDKVSYYLREQAFTGMPTKYQDIFVASYERPGRMRAGFEHYAPLLQDGRDFQALAAGRKLAMPVLVVGGAKSFPVDKLTSGVRQVTSSAPQVVVIPDAHHWLPLEQPKATAKVLGDFIAPTKLSK
jgi:pimeloyl-ACP methyl ester carboxylesterase